MDKFSLPPVHCPRCGGTNLTLDVHEGLVDETQLVVEPQSGNKLSEHQCTDCDGASFWM